MLALQNEFKVKSEKTKVKFAQSNINHVYKGNTTEVHQKPAVRQYGMQLVGKLQGTRRLPPPVWVPSLKAETGGLDSRVSLVPSGGGGWGTPSTSANAESVNSQATGTDATPNSLSFNSVNGAIYSDGSGSTEPAYVRSTYNEATVSTADPVKKTLVDATGPVNDSPRSSESKVSSPTQSSAVTNKMTLEKANSGGGLAANKPFFQRPAPVVTTNAVTATTVKTDVLNNSVKSAGGAREIVGDPSGWATVDHDEPNFDEHIVFSDEEGVQETPKISTANKQPADHYETVSSTPSLTVTSTNFSMKSFSPSTRDLVTSRPAHGFPSFQNMYINNMNTGGTDSWSPNDMSFGLNCLSGQPLPRHQVHNPFAVPPVSVSCGVSSSGQFVQHPMSVGVRESFYSSQLPQNRIITQTSNSVVDPMRPSDIDTELQQAQRQARTHEFNTAVERAQQARAARQKQSEGFPVDNESLLAKHPFTSNPNSESRPIASMSSGVDVTNTQANSFVLPNSSRLSVNALLNNVLPPQVLFPSSYQQAAGHSPDIAAAVAAATAAAMAYGGGQTGSVAGTSVENTNGPTVAPHVPITSTSNPRTMNHWHTPFVSAASTSAAIAGVLSQHPQLSQMLQSILGYSPNDPQRFSGAGQGVYIDTNFFFERFLEIINQQQQTNRSSTVPSAPIIPPKSVSSTDTAVQASSTTVTQPTNSISLLDSRIKDQSNINTISSPTCDGNYSITHDLESDKMDRNRRPRPLSQLSSHPSPTSTPNTIEEVSTAQRNVRAPGMMDVKASPASGHLANIWNKENYASDSTYSVRGRGKHIHSYKVQRGGAKGRASNKSYYTEMAPEFKSLSTYDTTNPTSLPSEFHFHSRSQKESKTNMHWLSGKQKSKTDESPKEPGFANTKSKNRHQSSHMANDETIWSHSDTEKNTAATTSSTESGTDECGDLSDTLAETVDQAEKYKEHNYEKSGSQRSANKQRPTHYNHKTDSKDSTRAYRTDYNRRTRRGRGGQSTHFTTSRTFNTDGYSGYSSRYTKGSEYDYYTLQQYGNSSTAHGLPRNSQLGQRKTRTAPGTKAHQAAKGCRNVSHGYSASNTTGGYFSTRAVRSHQYGQDYTDQFVDGMQGNNLDSRRHARSQKHYPGSSKSQFSATDYYVDYHHSDGEGTRQNPRTHAPEGTVGVSYRNNYEGNRYYKSYRKNHSHNLEKLADHAETEKVTKPTADDGFKKPASEEQEDSDITARVSTTESMRQSYSHSRNSRVGSQKSVGISRRTNNRSNQNHQVKRSDAQLSHGSRRYREMRDRYNDEKDGDGGAAAGGTGRSATGGGNYSSHVSQYADSGGGSGSNNGGSHCGGGQTDSVVVDGNGPSECSDEMTRLQLDDNASNVVTSTSHDKEDCAIGLTKTSTAGKVHNSSQSMRITRQSSFTYGTSRTERFSTSRQNGRVCHSKKVVGFTNTPQHISSKNQSAFTTDQHDFNGFYSWRTRSGGKYPLSATELMESEQNDTNDPMDSDSLYSDGFTKVVSKASKNFARRRLQQELSVTTKAAIVSARDSKQPLQDDLSHLETTLKKSNGIKQHSSVPQKTTSKKSKVPTPKLTFMGPPMCLNTSSSGRSTTSVTSASGRTATNSEHQSMAISNTHTWSKVVGTRTIKALGIGSNQETQMPPSSVLMGSNSIWQNELINQQTDSPLTKSDDLDMTKVTSGDNVQTKIETVVSVNSSDVPPVPINECAYVSMQSFWSAKDTNVVTNKIDTTDNNSLLLSNSSTACTSSSTAVSTVSLSSTQTSNNICKVKPQQHSLHISSASSLILAPIINGLDNVNGTAAIVPASTNIYHSTDVNLDNERSECECNSDISRPNVMLRQFSCDTLPNSNRLLPSTWSSSSTNFYPSFSVNQQLSNLQLSGHDNLFSSNTWPGMDQNVDISANCLTGTFNLNSTQSHYQHHQLTSNVLSNLLASNPSLTPLDGMSKQSSLVTAARHPHIQQPPPYQQSIIPTGDPQLGLYSNGPYRTANGTNDFSKLPSNNLCMTSKSVTFTPIVTPSMFVHPQSSSIQSQCSRSYHPPLSVAMQHSQIGQPQKCRQRVTASHQLDHSNYPSYANFHDLVHSEYSLPPGYVQTAPTGGLYSTIQTQTQPNYPQNPTRQPIAPSPLSNGNPWSILGNPTATSTLQAAGQAYLPTVTPTAGAAGAGLLPHPVPQGGNYGNLPCHFPSTTNHAPNFANTPNYVGAIGGGRASADHSSVVSHQRNLQHHGLYPHANLSQSPSAQLQQSFHLHTGFYSSLSPSHQRVPIAAQFGNSQARVSLPGHLNSQTGLYAAAFGGASHSPSQPTPPPINHQINHMNFFNNPFQYPARPGERLVSI